MYVYSNIALTCLSVVLYTAQKKSFTPETIRMTTNMLYEYRQPVRCEQNAAYNEVRICIPLSD